MKDASRRVRVTVLAINGLVVFAWGILTPILPLYLTDQGVSVPDVGLLFSVQMVALAAGEMTWGRVIDRFGPWAAIVPGSFMVAALMFILPFAKSIPIFVVLFIFLGISRSSIFVTGRWTMAVHAQPEKRASSMAQLAVIFSAMSGIASIVGGLMTDAWGYPSVFIAAAISPLLSGLLSILRFKELRFSGKGPQALEEATVEVELKTNWGAMLRLLGIQGAVAAMQFIGLSIFRTYMPLMSTQVIGTDATGTGILFGIVGFVQVLTTIPLAGLADRRGKKRFMILGLLGCSLSYLGMAFTGDYSLLVVFVVIYAVSSAIFSPSALALLSESMPRDRQATAIGMYGVLEDSGVITGSAVGGFIWDAWGHQATFLFGSLMAGLGAVSCLSWIKKPQQGGMQSSQDAFDA